MSEAEKSHPSETADSLTTDELPEQSGKEVHVPYWKTPPPRPTQHKIPPRQHIPPVPEGKQVPDDTPSPPVGLD
ncbi:MAG: hypothetical protein ACRD9S_21595 [Pyrinomonadaceae bacterium]